MKVLLIDPPWIKKNDLTLWSKIGSCWPSLGLAYIASVLEKNGHEVQYLDCTAEQISLESVPDKLKSFNVPNYVGITATTQLFPNAIEVAKSCKKIFNCKVVMGGVHPSVMPEETLSYDCIDYVVRDEGEMTMLELISNTNIHEITGLSYKQNNKIIHQPNRDLIKNLDTFPAPAYHLLPMSRYRPAIGSYKRLPAMIMFATRGCSGRCTYCHRTFYGKVRKRAAHKMIEEIKLLQEKYGIKEISFYDDTFTLFKSNILEFCKTIKEEGIDITWSCFSRVDSIDERLLMAMKEAGCHLILFGVESADEQILKNIKKDIKLDDVRRAVQLCRKNGIECRCSFMLGNPGETEETMKKTIAFAIDLDPDEVQFNITTLYPGTEMFNWADSQGFIKTKDWSCYGMSDVVWELPNLKPEVVQKYYHMAHKKFYLRPKIILRRLMKIRTLAQLKQEIKGALAVVS